MDGEMDDKWVLGDDGVGDGGWIRMMKMMMLMMNDVDEVMISMILMAVVGWMDG